MRTWIVVAALAACGKEEPPAPPPPAVSSAPAPWADVRAAAGSPLLDAPAVALADAERQAELTVPSRARIVRVLAAAGDAVEAGAPLLDLACPDLATSAATYLAASDQLAALARRHDQLDALRAEGLARASELASVELDQARLRGERDVAAATLRAAGVDPGGARELVESGGRLKLRAPIAGTVIKLDAAIGQLRSPDSGAVAELSAGGVHRVEARLARVLPDHATFVFVPAGGGERPATLLRVEPRRDADGTTRAWLDVDGSGLSAGEPGRVRAKLGDDVVAIPAGALTADAHVWRRRGDQRESIAVTVVARSGADALVRGLAVGDQVAARAEGAP